MNTEYKGITTVDGIKEYIGNSPLVAFNFETAPDDPFRDEDKAALDPAKAHIVGCSFSIKEGTGIYVPIAHRIGTNIDKTDFFSFLAAFLMNTTIVKIAHNIAFESSMAYAKGIVIQAPVYDTICASQMSLKSTYEFRNSRFIDTHRITVKLFHKLRLNRAETLHLCTGIHKPVHMIGFLRFHNHRRRQRKCINFLLLIFKAVIVHLHELCIDSRNRSIILPTVVHHEKDTAVHSIVIFQCFLDAFIFSAFAGQLCALEYTVFFIIEYTKAHSIGRIEKRTEYIRYRHIHASTSSK